MATERRALVTGAASGLGREVARQLVLAGHQVTVTSRDTERATRTAAEIGALGGLRLDVTDDESVAEAVGHLDRLDVLVNNAAAYVDWSETAGTADWEASRLVLETNLYGAWRVTRAALPLLRAGTDPRVVNVSSGAGSHGDPTFGLAVRGGTAASYGISKAALNALTSTLAAELEGTGILVNSVCPGLTATYEGAEAMGARSVEESARGVVWAATLPEGGPSGGFFRDGRPLEW